MTDAKRQKLLGQYPTATWVAEAIIHRHFRYLSARDFVIEPSCGPGSFLAALPAYVPAIGVEIDPAIAAHARANTGRQVVTGDFATVDLECAPTAIIGNPPFNLGLIDRFLDRAFALLPREGRVGFILPAYAFQTAGRVARYSERWSIGQEMIPRNIYPGLSLPLVFAVFAKDFRRTLVGFAQYRETADVQMLPQAYREAVSAPGKAVCYQVVSMALERLGGAAPLDAIYAEIEGVRPTQTKFWREKVRQTLRRYQNAFRAVGEGRYALAV